MRLILGGAGSEGKRFCLVFSAEFVVGGLEELPAIVSFEAMSHGRGSRSLLGPGV